MNDRIAALVTRMIDYEAGCPERIHHFLKVLGFAAAIARMENLPDDAQFVLALAAVTHDIGIRPSLEKFGSCEGPLQEAEGPPIARPMLDALGLSPAIVDRVCLLISRHHTYGPIEGPDHQILVEADFLVNILEGGMKRPETEAVRQNIFKTRTGTEYLDNLFLR